VSIKRKKERHQGSGGVAFPPGPQSGGDGEGEDAGEKVVQRSGETK